MLEVRLCKSGVSGPFRHAPKFWRAQGSSPEMISEIVDVQIIWVSVISVCLRRSVFWWIVSQKLSRWQRLMVSTSGGRCQRLTVNMVWLPPWSDGGGGVAGFGFPVDWWCSIWFSAVVSGTCFLAASHQWSMTVVFTNGGGCWVFCAGDWNSPVNDFPTKG